MAQAIIMIQVIVVTLNSKYELIRVIISKCLHVMYFIDIYKIYISLYIGVTHRLSAHLAVVGNFVGSSHCKIICQHHPVYPTCGHKTRVMIYISASYDDNTHKYIHVLKALMFLCRYKRTNTTINTSLQHHSILM